METIKQISSLPQSCGVYLFKNSHDKVIYVGKAKNIKKRVSQYFRSYVTSDKTQLLVSEISNIDFICTSTEKEALLLEFNLIKKYRPKYNILLRDDKAYLLFKIDLNHPYPRIQITRKIVKKNNCKYFGPYTSAKAARQTYKLLNKIFPIRKCKDTIFKNRTRPCLQYHIKRCLAPCCLNVSKKEYMELIHEVELFLKGKNQKLISKLEKEMWNASDKLEFEKAAQIRNKIFEIKKTLEQQRVILPTNGDMDVFSIDINEQLVGVGILILREGRLVDQKDFQFSHEKIRPFELDREHILKEILNAVIFQFYSINPYVPDKILLPINYNLDPQVLDFLQVKKGKKIQMISPTTSTHKDLLRLASLNIFKENLPKQMKELIGLSKLLKMDNIPKRIEVIDASHIMGKHTMVGMIVCEHGELKKHEYRIFKFEDLDETRDDYLTLHLWTQKRFKLGAPWPDLLIIDGGKGQLNAVKQGFEKLFNGPVPFKLISIAKPRQNMEPDKIYIMGRKNPLILPKNSKELLFIQFLRDNVHRFTISKTRAKARKTTIQSDLTKIKGIGPKTFKLLMSHFNSLDNILNVTCDELKKIPTIGESRSKQIYLGLQNLKEEVKRSIR
ncbi:excinuclease ABC subunit UvrC [Desulfothermus sp.]